MYGRKDFKYAAKNEIEDLIWLYGQRGVRAFNALKAEKPENTFKSFDAGGYYIFKDSWDPKATTMIVDCGYIGLGKPRKYIGSHGHSDILNIILTVKGLPFIVDSGCYTYTGSKYWHDYFRCTRGHNTVTIDGKDQCGLLSTWKVERQPNIIERHWEELENKDIFIEGSHDGYSTHADTVIHRRKVTFYKEKACYVLIDNFNSVEKHKYESFYHFYPNVELIKHSEENSITAKFKEVELLIEAICISAQLERTIPLKFDIEKCWYSDHYGSKKESKLLNISWMADVPCELKTFLKYS